MQVVAVGHGGGRLIAGWLDTGSKYLLAMALTRCWGRGWRENFSKRSVTRLGQFLVTQRSGCVNCWGIFRYNLSSMLTICI